MRRLFAALLLAALVAGCGSAPATTAPEEPPAEAQATDVTEPEPEPEPDEDEASPEETQAALEEIKEGLAQFSGTSWYGYIEDISLYISKKYGWDITLKTSLYDKPENIEIGKNICRAVLNVAMSANASPTARAYIKASSGGYVVSCRADMADGQLQSPMEFY